MASIVQVIENLLKYNILYIYTRVRLIFNKRSKIMDPGTIFIMASGGTIIMGTLGFLIYKIIQKLPYQIIPWVLNGIKLTPY